MQQNGTHPEIAQRACPLHQRAAHKGTAGQIGRQRQFGGGGFGVQLSTPIHHKAAYAALQQGGLGTQTSQHPLVLEVYAVLPYRHGKQQPLSGKVVQLPRPVDGAYRLPRKPVPAQ